MAAFVHILIKTYLKLRSIETKFPTNLLVNSPMFNVLQTLVALVRLLNDCKARSSVFI